MDQLTSPSFGELAAIYKRETSDSLFVNFRKLICHLANNLQGEVVESKDDVAALVLGWFLFAMIAMTV